MTTEDLKGKIIELVSMDRNDINIYFTDGTRLYIELYTEPDTPYYGDIYEECNCTPERVGINPFLVDISKEYHRVE